MPRGAMTRTSVGRTETTIMVSASRYRTSPSRRSTAVARRMPTSRPWSVVTRWIRLTNSAPGSTIRSSCRPSTPASGSYLLVITESRIISGLSAAPAALFGGPPTGTVGGGTWRGSTLLEEEVALGQRKDLRGFAGGDLAVDGHGVGLRVHGDVRRFPVELQVRFGEFPDAVGRADHPAQFKPFGPAFVDGCLGQERDGCGVDGVAQGSEAVPVRSRLRGRDRPVRVAHDGHGDLPALDDHFRFGPEELRIPQHEVGEFAHLDASDAVGNALREGRVDRVLGDVALEPEVVAHLRVLWHASALA